MTDTASIAFDFASVRAAVAGGVEPVALVEESWRRAEAAAQDGIFTALVDRRVALDRARDAARPTRGGRSLPLVGLTFSVKDSIHVEGMATTANCPGLSILPSESARAVSALEAAGAVMIGKNTLDQFATGLNGTRSPEPLCRNAVDPAYIPGGSSSGSVVAVARDIVAFSLGTDTGGSGRVPAACNGIVGVKPTIGLVSGRGLVYNSRLLDCIPIFARTCADANEILGIIAGFDRHDPTSRRDADAIAVTPQRVPGGTLAIPKVAQMQFFGDGASEAAFAANLATLRGLGFTFVEIDFAPFEEAGRLVFDSAIVAERLLDYDEVFQNRPETIHPIVREVIENGLGYSAKDAFATLNRMLGFRRLAEDVLADVVAMVVPTIPTIFTIDEMLAEPIARNKIMGTYTYFANPMNLCATSVPGVPRADGLPSALCFAGLAGADGTIAGLAARFEAAINEAADVAD